MKIFYESTAMKIRDAFFRHLDLLLDHVRTNLQLQFSPSDFDTVELDQEDFNKLFN
jgi:hypothetical protein